MEHETRFGRLATPEAFIHSDVYWVFYAAESDRFFAVLAPAGSQVKDYANPLAYAKTYTSEYITSFTAPDKSFVSNKLEEIAKWHRDGWKRISQT